MDILVSRLNQRMALQLPAELPLGLVFVVGEVQLPVGGPAGTKNSRPGEFYLADKGYRLPCRLSERAAAEFRLEEGDMVRAGGHLVFEPVLASYFLLARDIERLDGFRPAMKPLAAIIADSNRREQANSLAPAELPSWVQQMAPPEVRSAQGKRPLAAGLAMTAPHLNGDWELLVDTEAAVAYPEAEPALAGLSDELIAFLSNAMDSEVEVEITSEIMTDLNTSGTTERLSPEVLEALEHFEASMRQAPPARAAAHSQVNDAVETPAGSPAHKIAELPASPLADSPTDSLSASTADLLSASAADPAELPSDALYEQLITWLEQDEALPGMSEERAVAETGLALESIAPVETASTVGQERPRRDAPAATEKGQAARKGKSKDTIPWYLALLIIVIVAVAAIVLAALVFVILFPDSLPISLNLDLPNALPLIN